MAPDRSIRTAAKTTPETDKAKFTRPSVSPVCESYSFSSSAYIAISADELKEYDSQTGDTEGLVNFALSVSGVVFARRKQADKFGHGLV